MSAVVVSDTLSQGFGLRPDIKWPNDILINAKKISGILAETTDTPNGLAIVVGIGINIVSSNVPNELAESATSLRAELSSDRRATAAGLTNMSGRDGQQILSEIEQQLLHFFDYWYDALRQRKGPENIIEAWRDRSSYFSGRPVMVTLTNGSVVGTTDGLEPNGALRIRRDDGTVAIIHSGDVFSLRGKAV